MGIAVGRHRGVALGLLALVTAVATAGLTLGGVGLAAMADRTARAAAGDLGASDRGVRVTTRTADDPADQLGRAELALSATLDGLDDDAVDVVVSRLTYPLRTADEADVVLAYLEGWAGMVTLVAGTGPTGWDGATLEVAASVASAERLGLDVGSELVVGAAATPVRVTALWQPLAAGDPVWFSDPGLTAGTMTDQRGATGPLLTASIEDVSAVADRPLQRWTVVSRAGAVTADGTAALATGLGDVQEALRDAGALVMGSTLEGDGPDRLASIAAGLHDARVRSAVPLLLTGAAALVAVVAAGGAIAAATRRERELLQARGAGPWWLVGRDAPGVAASTVAGCLLGGLVALATGAAAARIVPVGAGLAVAATVVAIAVSRRRLPVDASRLAALPVVLTAVAVVLTGVAAWQLLRGGPVDGGGDGDLLAAAAPALVLALAGAAVVRPLPYLAAVAAPVAGRSRALLPLLTLRRLARGTPPVADAAALALAGGTAALAGAAAVRATPLGRPLLVACALAAVCGGALAVLTLLAGARQRRDSAVADAALLDRIAVAASAGATARRLGLAVCWLVATAVGVGVGALLAPLVLGGAR